MPEEEIRLGRYRSRRTGRSLFVIGLFPPDEKHPEGWVKIRQLQGAYHQTRSRTAKGFLDAYERWDF